MEQFSVYDLPLYLIPKFTTNSNLFILIQWFGVRGKTVGLKLEWPILKPAPLFKSFEECAQHFMDQSSLIVQPQDMWHAFSYQNVLIFLEFYFQYVSSPNFAIRLREFITKYEFPFGSFLDYLHQMPKKVVYHFEPYSNKHVCVRNVEKFLLSPQKTNSSSLVVPKPIRRRTKSSPISNELNEEKPPNWSDIKSVDAYFNNLELRLQTSCQLDPTLCEILEWKPERSGGWDLLFRCTFRPEKQPIEVWIQYLALKMNPAYAQLLEEYIAKRPEIQKHVDETSS